MAVFLSRFAGGNGSQFLAILFSPVVHSDKAAVLLILSGALTFSCYFTSLMRISFYLTARNVQACLVFSQHRAWVYHSINTGKM